MGSGAIEGESVGGRLSGGNVAEREGEIGVGSSAPRAAIREGPLRCPYPITAIIGDGFVPIPRNWG